MHDIALFDETLDINLTSSYDLSIQLSLDGFSFYILDGIRKKVIGLKHYNLDFKRYVDVYFEKIEKIFESDELLNKEYKNVKLLNITPKSTLVPLQLFDQAKSKYYFEFNHLLDEFDEIHYNEIKSINAVNIFTIHNRLANSVIQKFPKVKFYQQATPFLTYILNRYKDKINQHKVFINVYRHFFDIAVIGAKGLELNNSFVYGNESEIIYFISYVYKQFKLNPEFIEIIISGDIEKKSEKYNALYKYFRYIKFEKLNENFSYSYTIKDIPSQFIANLVNLSNCE